MILKYYLHDGFSTAQKQAWSLPPKACIFYTTELNSFLELGQSWGLDGGMM